ncbi:MAG TPA: hypothetical protein VGM77_02445 [Gemmatimonadales bacterium]|jgi:uncharacterized membrane protein
MGAMIALRVLHIGSAVFWGGSVLFLNFLVGPAMAAAGPDGIKFMQELNKRHYFEIMLGAAIVTILSGLDLMRRDSGGFNPSWFHSRFGMGLSTGMIAALIAVIIAIVGIKPAMRRIGALAARMTQATPEERPAIGAAIGAERARLAAFGGSSGLFVIIAIVAMAVARYL